MRKLCDKTPPACDNYNGCFELQGVVWRSWKLEFCLTPLRTCLSPTIREPNWRSGKGLGPPLFMHIYDWWKKRGEAQYNGTLCPWGGQGTFKLPSWLCFPLSSPVPDPGAGSSAQGGERKPPFGNTPLEFLLPVPSERQWAAHKLPSPSLRIPYRACTQRFSPAFTSKNLC